MHTLQTRADELAAAQTADAETSADRAAREATVRRLDNERQYLKSQLESEVTCKDELREALATATRQLGEIKVCYFFRFQMFSAPIWSLIFSKRTLLSTRCPRDRNPNVL